VRPGLPRDTERRTSDGLEDLEPGERDETHEDEYRRWPGSLTVLIAQKNTPTVSFEMVPERQHRLVCGTCVW
jgi:hypothetical protein